MASLEVRPGQIVKLLFNYSKPPKWKYCLAVCIDSGLFLIINSEKYRFASGLSQVQAYVTESPVLERDSWVDASKMYSFTQEEIERGVAEHGIWDADKSLLKRIKEMAKMDGGLPGWQFELLLKNL
jgi:hypothetical protein